MSLESVLLLSGTGLLAGIAIASLFWKLRQRKLEHVSAVRWSRRISDAEAARDENQARMDKALDDVRAREARVKRALDESEETLALLSDEKVPAFELELTRRNERIAELEHKAATYRARIADAADELAMTNTALEKANAALRERDARLDALAGIENNMRQMRTQTDRQRQRLATLETELMDRDRILALTREKADAAKEEQAGLERQVQTLTEQMRVERDGADTRLSELQSVLDDRQRQIQAAETQIEGLTAETGRQAAELETGARELTELRQRLSELESAHRQLQDAQARIADLTSQADRRAAELEAASAEVTELRQRLCELESADRQLQEAQARIADLTSQADRRAAELEAASAEVTELRQRLSELESAHRQLHDAQTRIADLTGQANRRAAELENAQTETAGLRQRVSELETHLQQRDQTWTARASEIDALTLRVGELQSELDARERRIESLATETEDRGRGIAEAREEARGLWETRIRDQARLEEKQAAIEELRRRISDYESELPSYQAELRKRDERIAAIQDEFAALREELPTLNDALRERESSIEDLAKELTRQRQRYAALQEQLIDSGQVEAKQEPAQVIRLREHRERRPSASAGAKTVQPGGNPGKSRPGVLADEPRGKADDLKRIRGVGPVLERRLNELGLFHFEQIAALGATDIEWMTAQLKTFAGRIERDDWVGQARRLAGDARADNKRSGG